MKVFIVTLTLSRSAGGLFYSVRNLSKALIGHGVTVEVAGIYDEYYKEDSDAWGDISRNVYSPFSIFSKYGLSLRYLFKVITTKCDVLYLNGLWNFASLAVLVRMFVYPDTKLVIAPRGMLDSWILKRHGKLKQIYWSFFERRLMVRSTLIHTLNSNEEKEIHKLGFENTFVCPNGTWIESIPPKLLPIKRKLIFLGRIDPKKGVVELLEAWSRISPVDWELIFYGWGEKQYLEGFLEKIAALSEQGGKVSYAGAVYGVDKNNALREASAFILPSYSEGLPMSVLEAWACRLPVAMTRDCNLVEALDKKIAFEISHGRNLSTELSEFIVNVEDDFTRLSQKSYEYVNENYYWGNIAVNFIKVVFHEKK